MKIVHWAKFFPPDSGGMESVTQTLVQRAIAAGHEVLVMCFSWHKLGRERQGDATIIRTKINVFRASQPLSWRYFFQGIALGRQADIVHLHAPNLQASLMALFIGHKPRLIVHWHSDVIGKALLNRLVKPVEAAMLRRANDVIATSQAYIEGSPQLQQYRHKVHAIPIGVPPPRTAEANGQQGQPNESRGLEKAIAGRHVVFSLGRQVPYKGFNHLIDAARHLPRDMVIVIGGGGPLHESLQRQVDALNLRERVLLPGRLSDAQVEMLFQRARLFCLPSVERSEAFGVVLLEALARGVPCIATNIDGSATAWVNLHGVTGLNVEPGNDKALAEAIITIAQAPAMRDGMSAAARQRYQQLFTEDRFAQDIEDLYRKGKPSHSGCATR